MRREEKHVQEELVVVTSPFRARQGGVRFVPRRLERSGRGRPPWGRRAHARATPTRPWSPSRRPPVRMERHAEDGIGVMQRRADLSARLDIPEPRGGVVARRQEGLAVGAEGDGDDLPRVPPNVVEQGPVRRIPEAYGAGVAAGHDPGPSRIEGDGRDRIGVLRIVICARPARRGPRPMPRPAIPTTQQECLAVGAEGGLMDRNVQGPKQGPGWAQARHVPERRGAGPAAPGQEPLRIGAEDQAQGRVRQFGRLAEQCAVFRHPGA